jgi:hypothetical protein
MKTSQRWLRRFLLFQLAQIFFHIHQLTAAAAGFFRCKNRQMV